MSIDYISFDRRILYDIGSIQGRIYIGEWAAAQGPPPPQILIIPFENIVHNKVNFIRKMCKFQSSLAHIVILELGYWQFF